MKIRELTADGERQDAVPIQTECNDTISKVPPAGPHPPQPTRSLAALTATPFASAALRAALSLTRPSHNVDGAPSQRSGAPSARATWPGARLERCESRASRGRAGPRPILAD